MININKDEYIILELIPTAIKHEKGQLVQLSAIKLKGLELTGRFDYRLNEDSILFKKIIDLISYDKESFTYKDKEEDIYEDFKSWAKDLPILYINDPYTINYINELDNEKEIILKYLNEEYKEDIIERLIYKYNLQPTNYIVDLLYESLIYESNRKDI